MFRLALELGKTVRELEQELTQSEFNEWVAYFKLIDEERSKND